MISQAIIYAAYLLVLLIHIGFGFEPISMIINLVIANYLFLIEPLTMITSRSRYFKDWKNYNDLIRSVLFDAYAVFYFIDISDNIEDILLVVVLILSFSRGLVYFAIFSNTRYFVFLVGEVLRDMTTFFIILVYSLLTFTFIFYALDTH